MFSYTAAFSSFSVDDLSAAHEFYSNTLDIDVSKTPEGLALAIGDGAKVFIYPKPDHTAASFTVLNFKVVDIDAAVEALGAKGVLLESFGGDIATDEKGVFRGRAQGKGPDIAWFKDPAGNFISILTEPAR